MAHTPGDSGPYKRQRTFVQDDVDSLRATSNQPIFQRSPVPLIPELTVSHPTTLPYGVIPSNSVQSPSYPFLPYLYNAHPDIPSKVEENSMPLTDQISNKAVRLPSISNIVDLPPFYSVKYPSNVSHVGSFHGEAVPIQRSVTCSHDSVMGQTIVDPYPMYHHHHSVGKVPEIPSASVNQFISPANPRVLSSNIKTEVPSQTSSNLPTLPHSRMQKVQLKEIIEQNHQENDTKLVPKETYQATSTVPKPVTQLKPMSNAEISFTKYLPKFSDISATTVSSLLAQVLHECHHHVSNEDFFNLLYNEEVQCIGSKSADSFFKLDNSESSKPKYHALELCLLILETFKDPASLAARFKDKSLRKLSFTSIKFHEILREFLALKIILSVVEPAKDASDYHPNISRISVYKVYYILCQRLIQSYPAFLSSTGQSIILGQSQLGKITKAAYPDLRSKRLGRRGHSRSHYIDVNWNESIVDADIFSMLDVELPQLQKYFNSSVKSHTPKVSRKLHHRDPVQGISSPNPTFIPVSINPCHNYVDLSCRYPLADCSPRAWKLLGNDKLYRSKWAEETLERSLNALNTYNVQLGPLIQSFSSGSFLGEAHNMLSQTVIQTITVLQGVRAEKEAYIHLYLVLLLLVFPLIVASDDELPVVAKSKLRHILNTCAAEVESVILNSAFFDLTSLSSFTKALKKMVSLNEMTSCTIKANCTDRALKQLMSYVESVANSIEDKFTGRSNLEQICVEAIVKPMNAYNFTLIDETSAKDYHDATEIISTLAKALAENVISAKDRMMMLPQIARTKEVGGGMAQDLPYQLFKISSEKFHEITADPLFLKLPVPIITPAVIHLISSMQYGHFQNTGLHDTELAEETSKCWWYFCCMIQEYVGIISEVVTLSQALAQWQSKSTNTIF